MSEYKGSSFQHEKSTCSIGPIPMSSSTIDTVENSAKSHFEEEAEPAIDHVNEPRLRPEVPDEGFRDIKTKCEDESSRQDSSNKTVEPRHDLEAGLENIPHHDAEVHFDRGWAWVVCATTFVMEFFVGGLITSSGVIYAALVDEFKKSRAETAWVSSLAVSTYYLFFPLGAILSERFGCWVVALLGTLACSIGLLSSSFVTSLPMLYLTYSVVWGMGASFVYFADLLILTKYFKARLAFANGIMALGGAVGGSILNPTMQQMFIHLGLANMFRVLSGVFLILSAFSLVYRPKRRVFPRNGDAMDTECEKKCTFDWEILKNKAFIMWIAVIFIFMLGYMVPFVHLVRLAEDIGIDKTRASLLLTFVTVGSALGRITFGRISDFRGFNRVYVAQLAFLVAGLSNFVVPLTESYNVLAVGAFIFGLFGACYLVLNPVIVCDILGPQKVSYGLGITFFVIAIPRTLGPLIAGWIYDEFQSYALAFYTLGGTTCLSAILTGIVPLLLRQMGKYEMDGESEKKTQVEPVMYCSRFRNFSISN